jgi:hypothetical protein
MTCGSRRRRNRLSRSIARSIPLMVNSNRDTSIKTKNINNPLTYILMLGADIKITHDFLTLHSIKKINILKNIKIKLLLIF